MINFIFTLLVYTNIRYYWDIHVLTSAVKIKKIVSEYDQEIPQSQTVILMFAKIYVPNIIIFNLHLTSTAACKITFRILLSIFHAILLYTLV